MLLVRVPGGSEVDISLGLPGYEESVVARAVPHDLGEERVVQLCLAEDLLIHKCLAGAIDVLDIEGIVVRPSLGSPTIRRSHSGSRRVASARELNVKGPSDR